MARQNVIAGAWLAARLLSRALICGILGAPVASAANTQLLSLTGIRLHPIKPNENDQAQYIAGFTINTWNVRTPPVP
jgi:hypothetical protein